MARVLVYDDSEDMALCVRVIKACGHDCQRFDEGDQLVAKALEAPPDLIVINPETTAGDGLQTLEMLKEQNPSLHVVLYCEGSLFGESCSYFTADTVLMKRPGHDHLFAFIKATFDAQRDIDKVPYHEFFF